LSLIGTHMRAQRRKIRNNDNDVCRYAQQMQNSCARVETVWHEEHRGMQRRVSSHNWMTLECDRNTKNGILWSVESIRQYISSRVILR